MNGKVASGRYSPAENLTSPRNPPFFISLRKFALNPTAVAIGLSLLLLPLILLLFRRPGFLDEHAESVDVATSKTDEVSRIDRRQSVAGSCGTIDRIGARGRTGTGDKGGGVQGNSRRVGVRFWDAEEEEEEEGGVVMVWW